MAILDGVRMLDEAFLRGEVEPYIDKLYLHTPLLKRHRDSATIHLLRILEDSTRFVAMKPFSPPNQEVQFHTRLRWAHEAIPWALRWVWRDCPLTDVANLDLDWSLYGEAHEVMDLGSSITSFVDVSFFIPEASSVQKR